MRQMCGILALGVGIASLAMPAIGAPAKAPSAKAEIDAAAQKGIAYLRKTQQADGSWMRVPGITGLCLVGMLKNGVPETDPVVQKGLGYLAAQVKPNGAIYSEAFGPAQALPNYNTSLSVLAFYAAHNPKYAPVIKKAQDYLAVSQLDEGEGYSPKDRQYGGIGYGRQQDNPDLSNLQQALEALKETGYPKNSDVFKKAITFIQRCQNRSESNDQSWAGKDGGFIYAASGESKADEYTKSAHSSYGSMTYAGLKSYLYCSITKNDPRVQSAWNWLKANYEVDQNPKMGQDGLYYYYHTMSKTLAVWGQKVVTDAAGKKHPWGAELGRAIVRQQQPDGSWKNKNARWQEDHSELATGYSLISLANCKAGL